MSTRHPGRRSGRGRTLGAALAAFVLLGAVAAESEEEQPAGPSEPAAPPAETQADDRLLPPEERIVFSERVVVTAQKREEDLRDVPISLTAFTEDQIREAGIETPEDVAGLTPNVFLAHSFTVGNSLVLSRGVGQANNGDSPLAVVVDGVYQGNQKQLFQELFDVERIEVLKGPEGALYGRNSIGGAINIVTRPPTPEFEGFARGSLGNGSHKGASLAASGPLGTDKLLYRLAGSFKDDDGYIENSYLGTKSDPYRDRSARLRLRWLATERFTVDWRLAISDSKGGAASYAIFPTNGFANTFTFLPEGNILGSSERDLDENTLRLNWRGDELKVTATTGFSRVSEVYRGDADFTHPGSSIATPLRQVGQGQDLDVDLLSQELQVASPDDRRWRWIAGTYFLATDRSLATHIYRDTDGTVGGFVPIIEFSEHNDNFASAYFIQSDFALDDEWKISTSLRYDRDRRDQTDLISGARRSRTFDAWQPRLTLAYQPSGTISTYVNAGTGFRSGGYNAPTITPDVFQREISQNVELGIKSTLAGGRLRLDGGVYYSRIDDGQFLRVDFSQGRQYIDNWRRARIFGHELSLAARPVRGLEVYVGWGYNDSEIRDFDGTSAYRGNQTPTNIKSTLNVGAQYAGLLTNHLVAIARADVERRGRQYWAVDNLDVQNPIALLNLRLTLASESWSVTAWGRNVTDEKYYVEYGDAAWIGTLSGDDLGWLGRPRTFGIDVTRTF